MKQGASKVTESDVEPVRVLGRGLRAQRGVHLTLRILRDGIGKTQTEVARESLINQADISRLESRTNLEECLVATLKRYVEALGGELDLVARFGDRSISLVGVEPQQIESAKDQQQRARAPRSTQPSARAARKPVPDAR